MCVCVCMCAHCPTCQSLKALTASNLSPVFEGNTVHHCADAAVSLLIEQQRFVYCLLFVIAKQLPPLLPILNVYIEMSCLTLLKF